MNEEAFRRVDEKRTMAERKARRNWIGHIMRGNEQRWKEKMGERCYGRKIESKRRGTESVQVHDRRLA